MTAAITDADRLLERVATAIRGSVAEDAYVADPEDFYTVVDGLVDFCEVASSAIAIVLEEAARVARAGWERSQLHCETITEATLADDLCIELAAAIRALGEGVG